MSVNNLSPAEVTRYSLQIALEKWGREAQEKVKSSRVLLAGGGGVGSVAALHLLATGVGCLRVVDQARVSLAELNSSVIYRERDLGKVKAAVAERRLKEVNPFVLVEGHGKALSEHNVTRLTSGCQVLIDAMGSSTAGYILNQAAVKHRLPLVHARVWEMDGVLTTFWPGQGPCLACAFPSSLPERQPGLIGPLPGIIGALLALEVLRVLGGLGPALVGRLLLFRGDSFLFREEPIRANPYCPVCRHLIN